MKLFSLTTLALVAAACYVANTVWVMYGLWNPPPCTKKGKDSCLLPYNPKHGEWHLKVYCSSRKRYVNPKDEDLIWEIKNIDFSIEKSENREVTLPAATKRNGSAFLHVFLQEKNHLPAISLSTSVTQYQKALVYFKIMENDEKGSNTTIRNDKPSTHWRSKVNIHVMYPSFNFHRTELPAEIYEYIHETKSRKYYPILYIDELEFKRDDLREIKSDMISAPIQLFYSPISIGKLRLWTILTESMNSMKKLGFTDEDTDQIKGIFTDTNIWFLALTFFVSTFHLLFEFLAFKHDLSYWRERETIEGLSLNTILYRCVSTIIIFLYLMDQQTSLIILVPAGIGSIIEIWKVTKALKMTIVKNGWWFSIHFGTRTGSERETEKFDTQAIKYLSYTLYPLCIGCAVYSLFYVPHKSLYSWVIQSLVNGVYAFGFLFMLPQLFINYKLKSVAHLPWKAFMYKAFNTFIDDVFAFIIKMPTSHRVACFRDDIVFFCYLYQRWLYPIDKKRANEYGVAYEKDKED